jgi:hypothetical protein
VITDHVKSGSAEWTMHLIQVQGEIEVMRKVERVGDSRIDQKDVLDGCDSTARLAHRRSVLVGRGCSSLFHRHRRRADRLVKACLTDHHVIAAPVVHGRLAPYDLHSKQFVVQRPQQQFVEHLLGRVTTVREDRPREEHRKQQFACDHNAGVQQSSAVELERHEREAVKLRYHKGDDKQECERTTKCLCDSKKKVSVN